MADVTITCATAATGARGQQLGSTATAPCAIVCPICGGKSLVRLETRISRGASGPLKTRIYNCSTPGCEKTRVTTVDTPDGEIVQAKE